MQLKRLLHYLILNGELDGSKLFTERIFVCFARRRVKLKEWKLIDTERVYHSKYMSLFNDKVMLPTGQKITYTRAELKDFVTVLPIIGNKIVMIEIFRYPANRLSLEIPSGYVENGEEPRECARRELEEEAGYKVGKLRSLGWFNPWTRSIRKAHLFLAEDLTKGTQRPDETEQIEVKLLSTEEIRKKLETNKITHAPTIIALQKYLLMQLDYARR
jgi:ADP-ribose pyrophosphatase